MMSRTRTALALVAGALAVALATPAAAQPWGGKPGPHFLDKPTTAIVEMMSKRLDLTDEQRAKIEAILTVAREDAKKPAEQLREIGEKTHADIKAVLTDEQKAKAEKAKEAFAGGARGFMRAHGPEMRKGMRAAGEEIRMRVALRSLDLSQEQKDKLQAVGKELREKRSALKDEGKPKLEALRDEARSKINEILTPEQRDQLEKKLKDMPRGPGGPRGPREMWGGGSGRFGKMGRMGGKHGDKCTTGTPECQSAKPAEKPAE